MLLRFLFSLLWLSVSLVTCAKVTRHSYGSDALQFGDLYLPTSSSPALANTTARFPIVLVIHGGYWYNTYGLDIMVDMCNEFATQGYASFNIEYRRIGDVGGAYPGTLQDVALAADYVAGQLVKQPEYAALLDSSRLTVVGHSAGGHLALWLVGRVNIPLSSPLYSANSVARLTGVLSLAGVSDLRACALASPCSSAAAALLGSPVTDARYADSSPSSLLPLQASLLIMLHGTADDLVPSSMSKAFTALAEQKGNTCELFEVAGAGHFNVLTPSSTDLAWLAVMKAMGKLTNLTLSPSLSPTPIAATSPSSPIRTPPAVASSASVLSLSAFIAPALCFLASLDGLAELCSWICS